MKDETKPANAGKKEPVSASKKVVTKPLKIKKEVVSKTPESTPVLSGREANRAARGKVKPKQHARGRF